MWWYLLLIFAALMVPRIWGAVRMKPEDYPGISGDELLRMRSNYLKSSIVFFATFAVSAGLAGISERLSVSSSGHASMIVRLITYALVPIGAFIGAAFWRKAHHVLH